MRSIARKHHYLPQSYLAAFTDTGSSRDGQFFVLDINNGDRFNTSPKNVAVERDFNRVDIEDKNLDALEQALSQFENRAAQAIRNVNCTKMFPSKEDYNYILNLLCLIAVRNPRSRESFNRYREYTWRVISDLLISDEKIWNYHLERAKETGYVQETNISYEEAKRFIGGEDYKIEFAPESNHQREFNLHDKLLPILGRRFWSLLIAPNSGPFFLCSDHPVALTWKNSDRSGPIGYGLKGTEVFFPLGPCTGFYGVYEEPLPSTVTLAPAQVAKMNLHLIQGAERHVFSIEDHFLFWENGEVMKINLKKRKE